MKNNFAYFIANYGKPFDMPTLNALKRVNAQYPIYIVVGTDDPKLSEYKKVFPDNLLVFDKSDYVNKIENLGVYSKTHKVCTYSRLAVQDFAIKLGIRYVAYLFDDIEYFQLRYLDEKGSIKSTKAFNLDKMMNIYVDLLNSSDDIYFVGPPQSSFYIGINSTKVHNYTTRYGNMLIYDTDKMFDIHRSSVLEDMDIVMSNNKLGKLSICPFGLQVCCRPPLVTGECYGNMSKSEYYQQWCLINQKSVNVDRPTIPYINFTPKIISDSYRKTTKREGLF